MLERGLRIGGHDADVDAAFVGLNVADDECAALVVDLLQLEAVVLYLPESGNEVALAFI